jgi:uncharacterized protein involved in outer membrane biogenesis
VRRLSAATGREVAVDSTSLALLGGPGIEAVGLSIGDDAAFPGQTFARIEDAVVSVDAAALLRGKLHGSLQLDAPTVRLARDASGRWNVESLGGGGHPSKRATRIANRERARAAAEAEDAAIRVTAASIKSGTLVISDQASAGTTRTLTLHGVDVSLSSPKATEPAAISLRGVVAGDGHPFDVRGTIGPFAGESNPLYQLSSVSLEAVPLGSIPGAPESISGELSFRGRLSSSGDDLDAVVRNATGDGELRVARGVLADGNLGRDVIGALAEQIRALDGEATLLARAQSDAALSSLLAARQTAFSDLGGAVRVDGEALRFSDLALDAGAVHAKFGGSLGRTGQLAVSGTVSLDRTSSVAIASLAPQLRPLLDGSQQLVLPVDASGSWPAIKVAVDVRRALASAAGRLALLRLLDPGRLASAGAPHALSRLG